MKLSALLFLPMIVPAQAVVFTVWSENFESYDTNLTTIEQQTATDWYTTPVDTDAIAVIGSTGLPASFGSKVLAVGGITPVYDSGEGGLDAGADPDLAFAVASKDCYLAPTVENPIVRLKTDLLLSPGTGTNITDSFRLSFVDGVGVPLTNLLFAPSTTQTGRVEMFRYNNVSVIDTGVSIPVNDPVRLEILFDPSLNKWSASFSDIGGTSSFVIFANVDMNLNPNPALGDDFGSFSVDWLRNPAGQGWGDNYLVMDNITLESVPEPGTLVLLGLSPLVFARRRRSKAGA